LEQFSQVNARSAQAEIDGIMEYMELSSFNLSSLPSAFRSIDGLRMHSADTTPATTTTATPIIYDDDANASRERRRRRKERKGRSRNRTIEDLLMLNPNLDSLVSNEDDDDDDDDDQEVGVMAAHEGEGSVKEYSYYHDDLMLNNTGASHRHSIDGDTISHHQHLHHAQSSIVDISISNKRPFDDDEEEEEDEDPMEVSAAVALSTCLDDRKPDEHLLEDSDEKSCGSSYEDDDDGGGGGGEEGGGRITGRHLRIASITTDVSGLSYDRGYLDQSHTPPHPYSYMMASHEHTHHQHGGSRVLSHNHHHHQNTHQPTSHYHPHHLQPHVQHHDYNHYHPSESSSVYTQHPLAPIADDPSISISRGISFMSIFSNKQSSKSRGDQCQHTHRGVLSKGGSLPTWHT
jgi:hypothetical protein